MLKLKEIISNKRTLSFVIVFTMIIQTFSLSFADSLDEINDFISNFTLSERSINPGSNAIYEYRFYQTEKKAESAKEAKDPETTDESLKPLSVQRVAKHGALSQIELVEEKDKLFDGWYYKDSDGVENKIEFEKQINVPDRIKGGLPHADEANNTGYIYAYPKYHEVNTVFFVDHHTVLKALPADEDKMISRDHAPTAHREGHIFRGWSIGKEVETYKQAEEEGILFHFKEDTNPTTIDGTKILYGIFEPGVKVSFHTDGGTILRSVIADAKGGEKIPAPKEAPTKQGYKFDYWYYKKAVKKPSGEIEYVDTKLEVDADGNFINFAPKKDTTVIAKYEAEKAKFHSIIMIESNPQVKGGRGHYEYYGTIDPAKEASFPGGEGLSESKIKVLMKKTDPVEEGITPVYYEDFKNPEKFEEWVVGYNDNYPSLKGFHLDVEKTNEELTEIKGDGTTSKVYYFKRDDVRITMVDKEMTVDGEDISHGFVYGALMSYNDAVQDPYGKLNRYIAENIDMVADPSKQKSLPKIAVPGNTGILSGPVVLKPDILSPGKPGNYMVYSEDANGIPQWTFKLHTYKTKGSTTFYVPYYRLKKGETALYDFSSTTTAEAEEKAKQFLSEDRMLSPGKAGEQTVIAVPGLKPNENFLTPNDAINFEGFKLKDSQFNNKGEVRYKSNHQSVLKEIVKQYTGNPTVSDSVVIPLAYVRESYALSFSLGSNKVSTPGNEEKLTDKTIVGVPFDSLIIGETRDFRNQVAEQEVKNYMAKFVQAEYEVTDKGERRGLKNRDKVTTNEKGEVFDGWFLDPTHKIPFDPSKESMPARNMQVFAKWSKVYHYISVHKYPETSSVSNKEENINVIKIEEGQKLSPEDPRVEYILPQGYTSADFQGWITYGDSEQQIPQNDGTQPFIYNFDYRVKTSFHLYPKFDPRRARVVYVYNFDEEAPFTEDEIKVYASSYLNAEGEHLIENKAFMSKFWYNLNTKLRLRAPVPGEKEEDKYYEEDGTLFVKEPIPPKESKVGEEGKVFVGWKIYTRDKNNGEWSEYSNKLYYYNSEFYVNENNVTYASTTAENSAIGALIMVAQWAKPNQTTNIQFHSNYQDENEPDIVKTLKDPIKVNQKDFTLPTEKHFGFEKPGYQFIGWSTDPDRQGKMYPAGAHVNVDEIFEKESNHLYAIWEKLHIIDLEKKWNGVNEGYPVKIGLMRRLAAGPHFNPDFTETQGFAPVEGSLKDLPANGKLQWEVPGFDNEGRRYAYVTVEIKPGDEALFSKKGVTWEELGVTINKQTRQKTQQIELTKGEEIDTFTSATARFNKEQEVDVNGKEVKGYNFKVTNEKIDVTSPIIDQPYTDETTIKVKPPLSLDVVKMDITFPDGTIVTLERKDDGTWVDKNDPTKEYKVGDDGRIILEVPNGYKLKKDDKLKATGTNKQNVVSKPHEVTVKDRDFSPATEKPVQKKKKMDTDGNSIVPIVAKPGAIPVVPGTIFTLQDGDGNPIVDENGKPYEGTVINGEVVFNIPEEKLEHGKHYKVETLEPGKKPITSELSDAIDLEGPKLITTDSISKVGENIDGNNIFFHTMGETGVKGKQAVLLSHDPLQSDFKIVKVEDTEAGTKWQLKGAGRFVSVRDIKVKVEDKFGNTTEGTFKVTVTDKDLVDAPKIDPVKTGDTSAKITPPANGDTLVITKPDGKELKLEKDSEGNWVDYADPENPFYYELGTDGKITIQTPPLKEGDVIKAQGKDLTGKLNDSPIAVETVKKSTLKTPTPQFDKITVGDKTFKIKPVDQKDENIITDKIVVTIRDGEGKEIGKVTLTKDKNDVWSDGTNNYKTVVYGDDAGKLIVNMPNGIAEQLTPKHSFGATGEDTKHGHEISDPTSINVNAKQTEKPTANQDKNDKNGNPVIKGKGVPGADTTIYDPTTGDKIAGPVKVDDKGNYEVIVPKDKLPKDKIVDVKQKEDGKPESEAEKVTIDNVGPEKPVIDKPNAGDKTVTITPPKDKDTEKITVTFPDGTEKELTKQPDGSWKDDQGKPVKEEKGKLIVPTPKDTPLKDKDKIIAVAEDKFGNPSEKDEKIVNTEDSFTPQKPKQEKNEGNNTIIAAEIPKDATPDKDTEYTLEDADGNPVKGPDEQPVKGKVVDGKIKYEVPTTNIPKNSDGTEKELTLVVKEPNKKPNKNAKITPDATGPVIEAEDVNEVVNLPLKDKNELKIIVKDKKLDGLDFSKSELPVGVKIEKVADTDGKPTWQLKGKPRDVITAEDNFTIQYTAVDKFGNKTEKTVNVVISNNEKTPAPTIDDITVEDKTVKVTPPEKADKITVKWPDGKTTELTKSDDGKWTDKDGKEIPVKDGKLDVPVPEGTTLNPKDVVSAKAQNTKDNKLPSDDAHKAVGEKSNPPTAKQGETKDDGTKTIKGTGIPGSDINVYDPDTGEKIAGPIKVKDDGTYEVDLPDTVKDGNIVNVTQTEKDKPESDPVPVTIRDDVKEADGPNAPIEEGRVRIIFDATDKGELDGVVGGKKYLDVVTDRVLNLEGHVSDPVGIEKDGLQFTFKEWDTLLKGQFKANQTITALYNNKWIDLIPVPGLTTDTIITNVGVEPTDDQYRNAIKADGNLLPDDATINVDIPADVSTPGDKEAKVTITYANGSTQTISVPVKVLKDVYPSYDNTKPADVPDEYVKITLDPTEKGYYDNGPKVFYVRPGVEVTIPANDAKGLVLNGQEWIFEGWDKDLINVFNEDTVIKAIYKKGKNFNKRPGYNPCPKPDIPDKPQTKPCDDLKGIHKLYIIGYPDGEFKPEDNITRAEVATIFARLLSDHVYFKEVDTSFDDVKSDHWASGAIAYLNEKGILNGRPDGKFYPQDKMTRAEYATVISNMKKMKSKKAGNFIDIDGHWAEDHIKGIAEYGIILGYEDNTFRPDKKITRAEAVTMTNRAFDRIGDRPFIEKNLIERGRFPDVLKEHWAYTDIYEASLTHRFTRNKDNTEKWYDIIELGRELGINRQYN